MCGGETWAEIGDATLADATNRPGHSSRHAASLPRLFSARIGRTSRPKRSASSSCR
jgi:hypothetical protein